MSALPAPSAADLRFEKATGCGERVAGRGGKRPLRPVLLDDVDHVADRVRQLAAAARKHTKVTGEPAYRMLQILTHLRGEGLGI